MIDLLVKGVAVAEDQMQPADAGEDRRVGDRFRGPLDAAADPVFVVSEGGQILASNPATEVMFGYEAEQMHAMTVDDLVPERFRKDHATHVADFFSGIYGDQLTTDVLGIRSDGSEFHAELRLSRFIQDEQLRTVAILRDVSEQKQTSTALDMARASLAEAQEVARLGSYVLDVVTGRWESSSILHDIFGIDASYEHDVASWLAIVHEEDREMMAAYFQTEVLSKHQPFDKEYRITRVSDGQMRWVSGLGRLEFDSSGVPTRMIGTIQDVTQRKAGEDARLQLAIRNEIGSYSGIGTWSWDTSTDQLHWSDEMFELFDADKDAFSGTLDEFWAAVHPDDRAIVEAANRAAVESGHGGPLEYRLLRPDGSVRNVWTRQSDVVSGEDPPSVIRGIVQDVTERVQAELLLQQAGARQRALLHELVSAEESERVRIATDLHDEPVQKLAAALLRLSSARKDATNPEAFDHAERLISESLQQLRHMMSELRPQSLDDHGLAAAVGELIRSYPDDDPVCRFESELLVEPSPDTRTVAFRIVAEALSNVHRHAQAKHVDIVLSEDEGGVSVVVRDDGIGIESGILEEGLEGHLGLGLMRERAEMSGGWARIVSRPSGGTTVEAWLPIGS